MRFNPTYSHKEPGSRFQLLATGYRKLRWCWFSNSRFVSHSLPLVSTATVAADTAAIILAREQLREVTELLQNRLAFSARVPHLSR